MTTQTHALFVSEPIGEKPVTTLAGIGNALGGRLIQNGFHSARQVLGMFLILQMDEAQFKAWLNATCGANAHRQNECYVCLRDWYQQHPF